eukprot:TRINITY_DN27725_c0_g1_i1.p1 TRINITY_DN27725_c0_g1~~TRINITY_DN27725_c0_g1_i1.p1  ORF type:complete len:631 (+),score=182.20 TRINITY_DN27725_c0_g1_i1:140-2032(+)
MCIRDRTIEPHSLSHLVQGHNARLMQEAIVHCGSDQRMSMVFGCARTREHVLQAVPCDFFEGRAIRTHTLQETHLGSPAIPDSEMLLLAHHSSGCLTMGPEFLRLVELIHCAAVLYPGSEHRIVLGCIPEVPHGWSIAGAIQDALASLPGASARVVLHSLPLLLSPQSTDVISMNLPSFHREVWLQRGPEADRLAHSVAQAIGSVEGLVNSIDILQAKGDLAEATARQVLQQRAARPNAARRCRSIGRMVILDRSVDLFTPCVTELTYSGFLERLFGSLSRCAAEVMPGLSSVSGSDESCAVLLSWDHTDPVWEQLRLQPFHQACQWLIDTQQRYNGMQAELDQRMSVQQMRELVDEHERITKMKPHLVAHLEVLQAAVQRKGKVLVQDCELVKSLGKTENGVLTVWDAVTVEPALYRNQLYEKDHKLVTQLVLDLIEAKVDLTHVLRVLGLVSMSSHGMHTADLTRIKARLVHGYGLCAASAVQHMMQLGMIKERGTAAGWRAPAWKGLDSTFDLSCEPSQEETREGFEWYTPLSTRLIEMSSHDRWRDKNAMNQVRGKVLEARHRDAGSHIEVEAREAVLVVMLGGCSVSELASIQALSKETGAPHIVLTTSLSSGADLVESLQVDWR